MKEKGARSCREGGFIGRRADLRNEPGHGYKWLRFAVLIFGLTGGLTNGQERAFHVLTVEQGLSQNSVLSFTQDRQGFMWIGTAAGLNRYDARNFKVYRRSPEAANGLTNDYILCLLTDGLDNLWVGTEQGLFLYDRRTDRFNLVNLRSNQQTDRSNTRIRALCADGRGRIWVGTLSGLFLLSDSGGNRSVEYVPLKDDREESNIRAIRPDAHGNLWVGSEEGIYRVGLQYGKRNIDRFTLQCAGKSEQELVCTSIEEDPSGRLWFGTVNAGLFGFEATSGRFTRVAGAGMQQRSLPHDYIRKLMIDQEGRLWIGTQEGLCVWQPGKESLDTYRHRPGDRNSVSQNSIYDVFQDRAGNIWTGTYYGGVNVSYARNTSFRTILASGDGRGTSNNVISGLLENSDGGLWIATDGGGLNYRDPISSKFIYYRFDVNNEQSIGSNLVKTIFRDSRGKLWIGTHGGGLNLFDSARKRFTRILRPRQGNGICSNDIVQIREDKTGRLWIGSEHDGLNLFDPKTQQYLHFHPDSVGDHHLTGHDVRALWIDRMDNVWVGTERGLQVRTPGQQGFRQTSTAFPGLADMPGAIGISSLYEDAHGELWIGSAGSGLYRIQPKENRVMRYSQTDGLPAEDIKGIIEDLNGKLWLATNKGLCRFDPRRKEFHTYNVYDGLPGNDFTANAFHRTSDGIILVGGLNGIVQFDPAEIQRNDLPSQIAFSTLRIGDRTVQPEDQSGIIDRDVNLLEQLDISQDQNDFSIDFQLLNFIKPWKNSYAYLLDGYETAWHQSQIGTATYSNLPAGRYTLRIRAANNDGIWEKNERHLTIHVRPAPWVSWWAYLIYLIATGSLGYFIIRYFLMRHRFHQEQALQRYKLEFFTNISHEIRTRLTLIASPLERIDTTGLQDDKQRTLWQSVRHHTEKLTELVQELLDFRKAETGHLRLHRKETDLRALTMEIAGGFEQSAEMKGVTLVLPSSKEEVMVAVDRAQFGKVISNLLANAVKFTPRGGQIGIVIEANRQTAMLKVWDSGIGIAPAHLSRIFNNYFQVTDNEAENTGYGIGLALARRIVELHEGHIEVTSLPPVERKNAKESRTAFTVSLPRCTSKQGTVVRVTTQKSEAVHLADPDDTTPSVKPQILVVEDNAELRQMLEESLSTAFDVMTAEDGRQGLEIARANIPDLIVSDIMMPVVDGLQLCDRLKSEHTTSHIPIILLTAKATLDDRITGLQHRADAYISKPFSLKLLMSQISNLIDNRKKLQEIFRESLLIPDKPTIPLHKTDDFLLDMINFIERNLDHSEFNVAALSKHAAMSQPVLYKKIKALTGLSVNDFIKSIRLRKASELLLSRSHTIYEVAYMVGFSDRKYFSREFKKAHGVTPSEFALQKQTDAVLSIGHEPETPENTDMQ